MVFFSEQIEDVDDSDSQDVVVHAREERSQRKEDQDKDAADIGCLRLLHLQRLIAHQSQQRPVKGQYDVLVGKLQDLPAAEEVKGHFAEQGKEAKARHVAFSIAALLIAFGDAEGKDRHRDPSDRPHPVLFRKKASPTWSKTIETMAMSFSCVALRSGIGYFFFADLRPFFFFIAQLLFRFLFYHPSITEVAEHCLFFIADVLQIEFFDDVLGLASFIHFRFRLKIALVGIDVDGQGTA